MYEAPRELCSTSRIYGRVVVLMVIVGVGVNNGLYRHTHMDIQKPKWTRKVCTVAKAERSSAGLKRV